MTTREWLLKIARAVEDWPMMPQDNVEVAISVSTPAGAVTYILSKVSPEERTRVHAGLPTLTTDNFAAAAQQIREAAEALD
jgi:hypothetical protein